MVHDARSREPKRLVVAEPLAGCDAFYQRRRCAHVAISTCTLWKLHRVCIAALLIHLVLLDIIEYRRRTTLTFNASGIE